MDAVYPEFLKTICDVRIDITVPRFSCKIKGPLHIYAHICCILPAVPVCIIITSNSSYTLCIEYDLIFKQRNLLIQVHIFASQLSNCLQRIILYFSICHIQYLVSTLGYIRNIMVSCIFPTYQSWKFVPSALHATIQMPFPPWQASVPY